MCDLEEQVIVATFPLDTEYRITTLCLGQEGGAVNVAYADMYLNMNGDTVRVSHSDA